MPGKKVGGIRLQTTLITVGVVLTAMVIIVGLSAYAAEEVVRQMIVQTLVDRLDAAQVAVEEGDIQQAIDHSGIELLQVVDKNGHVIASTPNVQGLSAIEGDEDDAYEIDDFEFGEDDDDDDAPAGNEGAVAPQNANADPDDDDDDDDADDDWDDADDDGGAYRAASDDDDDWDDGDDDGDDDDDDDAGRASDFMIFNPFTIQRAYAAEAQDVHSLEASSVMGTPGPFLVVKRTVQSPEGPMTLIAMASLYPALETAAETARILTVLLLFALALAALFAWHMTGRTLRPVDTMRREVEAISARDLSERITPPENDRDLSALANTFNGLLTRIEASVEEQKRFVSDASHELKSPIASTNLMLETLREHPESVDRNEVLADLTAENARLAQIVDDLLTLARQDEGRLVADIGPTDYYDVLYEETSSLQQRFPVQVDTSEVNPIIGPADATLLSHAVRNLLDNAARYATSKVKVACREQDGFVRISISDDGPGIPEKDRERVFGRFVRLEEGRERKKGSTGLGLSVARGNIARLGGRVYFTEPEIGGATAVIELPLE